MCQLPAGHHVVQPCGKEDEKSFFPQFFFQAKTVVEYVE
jgi:hypothetical protein